MEYKEITCPACHEVMQAPVGREQIKCMFCGQDIYLGKPESEEAAIESLEEAKQEFSKSVPDFFVGYEVYVKNFKRETYADQFAKFGKDKETFIKQCVSLSQMGAEGREYVAKELANTSLEIEKSTSKLERSSVRLNNNLYMVTYMLPTLLSDKYNDKVLAETICETWKKTIKEGNIRPADYEQIKGGFKRKLCYITTAVCKGLGKGEDAEEISILKNFRDGFMMTIDGGECMVNDYYDYAPTIVKRIEKSENPKDKYIFLWENFIHPCVDAIESGNNDKCLTIYTTMVQNLKDEYMRD